MAKKKAAAKKTARPKVTLTISEEIRQDGRRRADELEYESFSRYIEALIKLDVQNGGGHLEVRGSGKIAHSTLDDKELGEFFKRAATSGKHGS